MESEPSEQTGMDRRSLLRKGVVAGAIAWTAPAVLSSPAFAQTASVAAPTVAPGTPTFGPLAQNVIIPINRTALANLVCRRPVIVDVLGPDSYTAEWALVSPPAAGASKDFTVEVRSILACRVADVGPRCIRLTYRLSRSIDNVLTVVQTGGSAC